MSAHRTSLISPHQWRYLLDLLARGGVDVDALPEFTPQYLTKVNASTIIEVAFIDVDIAAALITRLIERNSHDELWETKTTPWIGGDLQ